MSNHGWHGCVLTVCLVPLTACGASPDTETSVPSEAELTSATHRGAVFTMNNSPTGNAVLAFQRARDGSLTSAGETPTGGLGSGASLGSQGSVTLSGDGRFLLVVNAGSNEVTSFLVRGTALTLRSTVASGGILPTSVAERDHVVYVLNAGPGSNIVGFWLDAAGQLHSIPGSTRALSTDSPSPAQVAIAPLGLGVIVTEKGTNSIDAFGWQRDGTLGALETHVSSGGVPYGFGITARGTLVVSEAAPGAVSSYSLDRWRGFMTVSASVADHQQAPCWVVITHDGHFAYTANAGSQSISGYEVSNEGSLRLLDASGVTGATGANSKPLDMAIDADRHLYAVDAGNHAIVAFDIAETGALAPVASTEGMPSTIVGVAAL